MSVFDQRGQNVTTQYNIAGDYNFAAAKNQADIVEQLEKLSQDVSRAIAAKVIEDEETANDLDYNMKKAVHQARKPEADKSAVLEYLGKAKELIATVAAASGLVVAIGQAVEMVQKVWK